MQRWVPSKHMATVHVEISGTFFYMTQEYTCWCPLHTCVPQLVGFAPIQCRHRALFSGLGTHQTAHCFSWRPPGRTGTEVSGLIAWGWKDWSQGGPFSLPRDSGLRHKYAAASPVSIPPSHLPFAFPGVPPGVEADPGKVRADF